MIKTCIEVSRSAFLNNVNEVQKIIGNALVMPVVKANAYGTYLNRDIDLMNRFDIVAVAMVEEAVYMRKLGYKNDILVLNQPYIEELDDIVQFNIIVGVSSCYFLEQIKESSKQVRVHIEIETGMGRTGVLKEQLDEIINIIKESNVVVEGVYTHLSSADSDYEFTNKQMSLFEESVHKIKENFNEIKYIHCAASSGILNFKLGICNMVRPGIILYGYLSSLNVKDKITLKPTLKFRSRISFIKDVEPNDSIGYNRSFIASSKMKVATVSFGYADGVMRKLSNKGFVSVNGKRCKILGNICMDSFMIDVTDCNVQVGDIVYLFDNQVVTLDEISNLCDTINYEVISTIGERVKRVFVD